MVEQFSDWQYRNIVIRDSGEVHLKKKIEAQVGVWFLWSWMKAQDYEGAWFDAKTNNVDIQSLQPFCPRKGVIFEI